MLQVLCIRSTGNDDVVNVASHALNPLEDGVHCPLENGRGGGNAKWESSVPIQTLLGVDGYILPGLLI